MSDSTSPPPDPDGTSEREGQDLGAEKPDHIDREVAQQLIATLVGLDSPAVRALVEQLSGEDGSLDSIVDGILSDPSRLEAVRSTGLLDGAQNPSIDRLTALTAEALGTPLAAIVLIDRDRQIIVGCSAPEAAFKRFCQLDMSLAKFPVVTGAPLMVDDTAMHPLLAAHPAVQASRIRAYAGVPLVDARGNAVGTLSTWDEHRRQWTSGQIQILNDLAEVACAHVFASSPPVRRTPRER